MSTNKKFEVIVAGGGTGGVPAAVAAARNGAKVLLIEKNGFLGGTATAGLVFPFMKYVSGKSDLSQGIFKEFTEKMKADGYCRIHDKANTEEKDRLTKVDEEMMKLYLDEIVIEAGVTILFHTQITDVVMEGQKIKSIVVCHKGGMETIDAEQFIDATGDADVAAMAGAEIKIGRDKDGACQPMTSSFRVANINRDIMPSKIEISELYLVAKEKGEINNPRENVLLFFTQQRDVIHFNTTRVVGKSALDAWSISEAEIEGRKQIKQMMVFFKKYIKGFENAYLQKTNAHIGVRESRRVMAEYILTAEDVLNAKHFDDGIACSNYDIDIHNPAGTGTVIESLKPGTYYKIPYRCLVPKNIENLLIGGKSISSTHEAFSSLRVMASVWNIGEASGTAAAMCLKEKIEPKNLDTNKLKENLINAGAFL